LSGFLDEKLREKFLKAFLDLAILSALRKESMNGYEMTVHFTRKFGIIMNPSVIYTTIYSMERDGLVMAITRKRGRIYELTRSGEQTILNVQDGMVDLQNLLKLIIGKS
jgi:DNA-binding PadR family transcriptional regulator